MDRLDRRGFRLLLLALAVIALALRAYVLLGLRTADPDMFWHIATGRWIVGHGAVPTTDPFSWWAAPRHQPWVAMEWLFGLVAYGVFSFGGYSALYWLTSALVALFAVLAYALMRARGVPPIWATVLAIVVMTGVLGFMAPRPQVVTFVLVTLTALLLEKGRWKTALLVVLVGVNFHGGVWPIYVIVFAFYELPKRWWLVAAAFAVTFVNPNPAGVALYPLRLLQSPVSTDIMEWAPTALWTLKGDLIAYVVVILAVHRKRVPLRDALFALAFMLLSLSAVRHVAWFYVLVVPVLAPYIVPTAEDVASWRLTGWLGGLRERLGGRARPGVPPQAAGDGPEADAGPGRPSAVKSVLDITLVAALGILALVMGVQAAQARPDVSRGYPRPGVIAFLKDSGARRVFNMWGEGGYLILNGVSPMIDGRFDPYLPARQGDPNLAQEFVDAVYLRSDPHAFMARWGVDYAVVTRGRVLMALQHDPAFVEVKSDENHVVFRFDPSR